MLALLQGCGEGLFAPSGPIADGEHILLLDSMAIMLAIVVPTILAILAFAWWFRASNKRALHLPEWSYSGQLELLVWSVPVLVIMFLGGIAWISSHDLDPARRIESSVKPLEVQVVSLDWKWLFIYPEQKIASVNQLVVPVNVPLHLRITSASVMNVFFVPQIGSEIYCMYGMATQLNLEATQLGNYPGLSAHFSGDGFAGMAFHLDAVTPSQFNGWIAKAQAQGPILNESSYRSLLTQSKDVKPYTYREAQPGIFDTVVLQKLPSGDGPQPSKPGDATAPQKEK